MNRKITILDRLRQKRGVVNDGDTPQKRGQVEISDALSSCQMKSLPSMSIARVEGTNQSICFRFMLMRKRFLGYRIRHAMRKSLNRLIRTIKRIAKISERPNYPLIDFPLLNLKPGDFVRVRSYEEIQTTLDYRRNLKGCGFMEGMRQYCGTTQRVLKPIRRFVDERDYRLKKCDGVVFLEGATCNGDATFGECDRTCFYFWREEWLEKIES